MLEHDDATGLLLARGARPPAHTWECRKGHRRSAAAPFRLQFKIGDENVLETRPLCAVCVREWMERQFGVKEVKPPGRKPHAKVQAGPTGNDPRRGRRGAP